MSSEGKTTEQLVNMSVAPVIGLTKHKSLTSLLDREKHTNFIQRLNKMPSESDLEKMTKFRKQHEAPIVRPNSALKSER